MITEGSILPRFFEMNGRPLVIENGVSRDMLKAGMIAIETGATKPEREMFRLTDAGCAAILHFIGQDQLVDLGVLEEA
jgi:hypothetical protein